ncbi:hypothetical protein K2173_026211 [Erythroxylum novogranatense]|uniref:RNA polymerase Rpb7-like N-terminal domain-containing protein n=1 Tax=Erythroxylum novogranatense TaxID=1862640 RepID=A0AAV8SBH7_9ROSI|nr:hypothetical protein K2173_026211 [Erythroxylum novogranatense]
MLHLMSFSLVTLFIIKGFEPKSELKNKAEVIGQVLVMFYLSLIEHKLRLPPYLLSLPLEKTIEKEFDNIFLDKVFYRFTSSLLFYEFLSSHKHKGVLCFVSQLIANLGLCVSAYDIRNIDRGFIFPGANEERLTPEWYKEHGEYLWVIVFLI